MRQGLEECLIVPQLWEYNPLFLFCNIGKYEETSIKKIKFRIQTCANIDSLTVL